MDIEKLREYCICKKGVTEEFPFGEDTLVYKVGGKMFAFTGLEGDLYINLKCDPELAMELRERYPAVQPGYHMNKTHWNTVLIDGSVSDKLVCDWVDHSYNLVLSRLPKRMREALNNL